jgi:hypothetical protein
LEISTSAPFLFFPQGAAPEFYYQSNEITEFKSMKPVEVTTNTKQKEQLEKEARRAPKPTANQGKVRIVPPFPQQLPRTTSFNKFKDTKNFTGAKTKLEHLLLHNLISSKSATPLQAITAVEPSQSLALVLLVDSEVMPLPSELPRQSPAWSSPPPEVALPNIST